MIEPVTIFLSFSLIAVQNLVAVFIVPKILGMLGPATFGCAGVADP